MTGLGVVVAEREVTGQIRLEKGLSPVAATMAYREYTDSEHVFWRVWEVIPQSIERRRLLDRRLIGRPPERRHRRETRLLLSNGAAQGWLVFESATERRRLRPIPVDWFETSDEALAALGVRATPAGRPSRRLIE